MVLIQRKGIQRSGAVPARKIQRGTMAYTGPPDAEKSVRLGALYNAAMGGSPPHDHRPRQCRASRPRSVAGFMWALQWPLPGHRRCQPLKETRLAVLNFFHQCLVLGEIPHGRGRHRQQAPVGRNSGNAAVISMAARGQKRKS